MVEPQLTNLSQGPGLRFPGVDPGPRHSIALSADYSNSSNLLGLAGKLLLFYYY